jgi:hypothetical protein
LCSEIYTVYKQNKTKQNETKDDDMRNDAAYSLSLASSDSGFSPLLRDLNEREIEQLSISKNQLLHAMRQNDPVSVSRQENDNDSNYRRDDSTIPYIVSSSKSIQQLNIFTGATHNSNLVSKQHYHTL